MLMSTARSVPAGRTCPSVGTEAGTAVVVSVPDAVAAVGDGGAMAAGGYDSLD